MIGQNNQEPQLGERANTADKSITLNNINNPTQVGGSQVDVDILQKNMANKVRSEVDSVMTMVESRVHDAVLTVREKLVIRKVEQAMKWVNASSGQDTVSVVLELDQRDFSTNIEGLQMTALSRINSNTDLNRINETRGSITVEVGDLTVNARNLDWQAHTHHMYKHRGF